MDSKHIYSNLCAKGKLLKEQYGPGSGLHAHHIIPKHSNGVDDPSNITYLTIREHVIAHYLLWRIYKNPNDLRAMRMLGANITPSMRRVVGIFCRDNNLGIHGATPQIRRQWSKMGMDTQQKSGSTNTFYFWSTKEGRRTRAALGGKASWAAGNNETFAFWCSPEGRKKRAQLGAAASPRKPATNEIITKKFYTDKERQAFIAANPTWRIGCRKRTKSFSLTSQQS